MRLATFVALASAAATAVAHSTVFGVWVNGVDQGDGQNQYIRSPPNNNPVKDLKSADLTCNANNRAVAKSVSVKAGDKVTFEWHHANRDDDIIDPSHKGPVLVYMGPSSGTEWTKIFEANNDGSSWAVDKLIAAHGQHSIIVPDVPAGDYILRSEIIALHEADALFSQQPARGAQFYPSCLQIKVTSNGPDALPKGVALPGDYTDSSSGILFNLYGGPAPSTYKAPGPAVWSGAKGGEIGRVGIPGQGAIGSAVVTATATATATATSSSTTAAPTTTTTSVTSATTTSTSTRSTSSGFSTVTRSSSSTVAPAPTASAPAAGIAALYAQCGGQNFNGPTACATGSTCVFSNAYYSQCLPGSASSASSSSAAGVAPTAAPVAGSVQLYGQCGGIGYTGSTTCASGTCKRFQDYYSQCLPN
ncbi:endoglucanase B [Ephemerocybe angulata]|uniref:AA9 family lytic polysaccharide monooxygenase n=1 Tax=Ephemerocybe angulata TaxID=980116 RepID=A0A8H6M8J1_9AGAR|nr:endoglucanase B [Tulosesus angulatus]